MDTALLGFIPLFLYYLGGLIAYASIICLWKKKDEGYTYISNTIRLEEL